MGANPMDGECWACRYFDGESKCRRFPPRRFVVDRDEFGGLETDCDFPWVDEDSWCGEFEMHPEEKRRRLDEALRL